MNSLLIFLSGITVAYLLITLIVLFLAGRHADKESQNALTFLSIGQILAIANIIILFLRLQGGNA